MRPVSTAELTQDATKSTTFSLPVELEIHFRMNVHSHQRLKEAEPRANGCTLKSFVPCVSVGGMEEVMKSISVDSTCCEMTFGCGGSVSGMDDVKLLEVCAWFMIG